MEKQQKDAENKINFLIQQLRNSEVRLQENSLLLRSSFDMLEKKKTSGSGGREGRRRGGGEEKVSDEEEGADEPEMKRPHTTPNIKSSLRKMEMGTGRSVQEEKDQVQVQEQEQEQQMKLINDLKRKLDTERYRREILEKRNGELMRELRQLKERK
jgi:hypothetical protein